MNRIHKYPRTQHILGSNFQNGDYDLAAIPFSHLLGKHLVIEEKCDGQNSAISYDEDWSQLLQSRGHYLTGGPRERHFNWLKQWAAIHTEDFLEVLQDRYIMYGEHMYCKHTVFYDALTHYFMEFDILDTQVGTYIDSNGKERPGSWLSTHRRRDLLNGLPITPVLVLYEGKLSSVEQLAEMVTESHFKTPDCNRVLRAHATSHGLDGDKILCETDPSLLMEGLYIKVEEDGVVKDRYKFVRDDFRTRILDSDSHWQSRPIVPNILAEGIELY